MSNPKGILSNGIEKYKTRKTNKFRLQVSFQTLEFIIVIADKSFVQIIFSYKAQTL